LKWRQYQMTEERERYVNSWDQTLNDIFKNIVARQVTKAVPLSTQGAASFLTP